MRKMSTNYFHGFVFKINAFHATECRLNPFDLRDIFNEYKKYF